MIDMKLIPDLLKPVESKPSRDGFGKALVELGEKNSNVWVLTADVSESTRTHWFADKFPKRFVQVGVAEQNLAGVAAGIAACDATWHRIGQSDGNCRTRLPDCMAMRPIQVQRCGVPFDRS
jgi:transketolase